MKKPLMLLLVAMIIALSVAAASEVDITTLIEANSIVSISNNFDTSVQNITIYNTSDGTISESWMCYIWHDENGGVMEAFSYDDGSWQIYGGGEGYGYLASEQTVYVMGFYADAYEENMQYLMAQNIGEFEDDHAIVSQETTQEGNLLITVEGSSSSYTEAAGGDDFIYRYVVNPETLHIISINIYMVGEDGGESLYLHADHEVNVEFEIPDYYMQIHDAEVLRELHVIADPGTNAQVEYVIEAPIDVPIAVYSPEGYDIYEDEECTVTVQTAIQRDENGNYPATSTIYAK
ncbi:MAG: hypothetical protein Q4D04_10255 [Clostridia bacterium]|nr:hypothetical protein [Clostridia bacterium]